jgi:hypothetical protein
MSFTSCTSLWLAVAAHRISMDCGTRLEFLGARWLIFWTILKTLGLIDHPLNPEVDIVRCP